MLLLLELAKVKHAIWRGSRESVVSCAVWETVLSTSQLTSQVTPRTYLRPETDMVHNLNYID